MGLHRPSQISLQNTPVFVSGIFKYVISLQIPKESYISAKSKLLDIHVGYGPAFGLLGIHSFIQDSLKLMFEEFIIVLISFYLAKHVCNSGFHSCTR